MTKNLVIAASLLCGSAAMARDRAAESAPPLVDAGRPHRDNRLTVGPLSVFVGAVTFEFEHAIGEHASLFIGPRIAPLNGLGIAASTGARFFPFQRAPSGLWIGPEFFIDHQSKSTSDATFKGTTGIVLGMVGYTFIADGGLTFSLGAGIGAGYANWDTSWRLDGARSDGLFSTAPDSYKGFIPALGSHANVGWAF